MLVVGQQSMKLNGWMVIHVESFGCWYGWWYMLNRLGCWYCLLLLPSLDASSNFIVDIIECNEQVWGSFSDSINETFDKSWSALLATPLLIKMYNDSCCNWLNCRLPDRTSYLFLAMVLIPNTTISLVWKGVDCCSRIWMDNGLLSSSCDGFKFDVPAKLDNV